MSQRIRGAITTAKYSMQLRRRSFPDNSQEGLFFMPSHSVAKIQSWTQFTDFGCKQGKVGGGGLQQNIIE